MLIIYEDMVEERYFGDTLVGLKRQGKRPDKILFSLSETKKYTYAFLIEYVYKLVFSAVAFKTGTVWVDLEDPNNSRRLWHLVDTDLIEELWGEESF